VGGGPACFLGLGVVGELASILLKVSFGQWTNLPEGMSGVGGQFLGHCPKPEKKFLRAGVLQTTGVIAGGNLRTSLGSGTKGEKGCLASALACRKIGYTGKKGNRECDHCGAFTTRIRNERRRGCRKIPMNEGGWFDKGRRQHRLKQGGVPRRLTSAERNGICTTTNIRRGIRSFSSKPKKTGVI